MHPAVAATVAVDLRLLPQLVSLSACQPVRFGLERSLILEFTLSSSWTLNLTSPHRSLALTLCQTLILTLTFNI